MTTKELIGEVEALLPSGPWPAVTKFHKWRLLAPLVLDALKGMQAALERLTAERDEARAELAKAGDAIRAYESMLDGVAEKAATEACEAVRREFNQRDVKERIQAARIAELEAALARLTTPRPIEEAPKDGTPVLAWTASVGWAVLRHLDSYGGWVLASHPTGTYNPTHFLPLPVKS